MNCGLVISLAEGNGYPLQCSGLENSKTIPWGHKESETTEQLSLHFTLILVTSEAETCMTGFLNTMTGVAVLDQHLLSSK